MMSTRNFLLAAAIFICALGCAPSAEAQLRLSVDLRTNYVPVDEFAEVYTRVRSTTDPGVWDQATLTAHSTDDFLSGVRVADLEFAQTPDGEYFLNVDLLRSDGALVARRTYTLGLTGDYALTTIILAPPRFSKNFSPATVDEGVPSSLEFTIDNSTGGLSVTDLDFTDNMPAGVILATPTYAATTCTGGTLTAMAGDVAISYTGGTVAAGASCTVSVNVTAASGGSYENTSGELTSSLGSSGTASATLTVRSPPVYRVGPDCDFPTIQEAVDIIPFQGTGILRIVTGTYNESVFIDSKNVQLIGGHADCTTTAPNGFSTIDALGTGLPAVRFRQLSGVSEPSRDLALFNLFLLNGTGTDAGTIPYPGGGLSVWTGADRIANIFLDSVIVAFNQSAYEGGGIALLGDGSGIMQMSRSHMDQNQVAGTNPRGGGLFCEGDYTIFMAGGSITRNVSGIDGGPFGHGGGLYLDGCHFDWYTQGSSSPDYGELGFNTAYGNGGGLFARSGSLVRLFGAHYGLTTSTRPLRIRNNQALAGAPSGKGGAIYAIGADTAVTVDRSWIHDNLASRYGGAISVGDFASVLVDRNRRSCHHSSKCSRIFNNHAVNGGGAVFVWPDGHGSIRHTMVENNTTGASGPIEVRGVLVAKDNGQLLLEDSLMYGAVGAGFAVALENAKATVHSSTIADTESLAVFGLMGEPELQILGSIVHETGETDMALQTGAISLALVVVVDCVISHSGDLSTWPGATILRAQVNDPEFIDRTNGVYYLQTGSPAINYCDGPSAGRLVDIDWNPRGILHSDQPEVFGPYDIGAYEVPLVTFSDRFEDGG